MGTNVLTTRTYVKGQGKRAATRAAPTTRDFVDSTSRLRDFGTSHPRVRGGTALSCCKCPCERGASPRARGNLRDGVETGSSARVHPRVRGGTVRLGLLQPLAQGAPSAPADWVHPRVRGGTAIISARLTSSRGASPRARGNRAGPAAPGALHGCIPACAGEPSPGRVRSIASGVHPRVRGGTAAGGITPFVSYGASPRARGNPSAGLRVEAVQGCIPACAGEPARST